MRGNLAFIAVIKEKDGTYQLNSFAITDMINSERLYKSTSNSTSWKNFYNKCCSYEIGSIICNCSPKVLRELFKENNIPFSANKSIVHYFDFIGLSKLKCLPVRPFIIINTLPAIRNIKEIKTGLQLARRMSECAQFWAEHNMVGLDILRETIINVKLPSPSMVGNTRKYYSDYMVKACSQYNLEFSPDDIPYHQITYYYTKILLWFDGDEVVYSAVFNRTRNGEIQILESKENPTDGYIRDIVKTRYNIDFVTNISSPSRAELGRRFHCRNDVHHISYMIGKIIHEKGSYYVDNIFEEYEKNIRNRDIFTLDEFLKFVEYSNNKDLAVYYSIYKLGEDFMSRIANGLNYNLSDFFDLICRFAKDCRYDDLTREIASKRVHLMYDTNDVQKFELIKVVLLNIKRDCNFK